MATRRLNDAIEPMTLGNMRELGVRSFHVSWWNCHHQAVLSAERGRDVAVPPSGRAWRGPGGIVGADFRRCSLNTPVC
jgi:hypothetical protein